MLRCLQNKVLDQAVKYIEDLQEDFDFRYKTLQSRGELCFLRFHAARKKTKHVCPHDYADFCLYVRVCLSDLTDRNSEVMKHEVIRLQEMLNSLDFKRKVRICMLAQTL